MSASRICLALSLHSCLAFAQVDLPMQPPKLITAAGPEYSDAKRDYGMTIGLERTAKGRLWAAFVAGGDSELGYFVLSSSDDEGETWTTPRLVIDPEDSPTGLRCRTLVGNLWIDPTGKLWLFFDQSMGYFDGRGGVWATICAEPDADQPTWSPPQRIWHGATLNKPTVLSDGTWLLPISLWRRDYIHAATEPRFRTIEPHLVPADFRDRYRELDDLRLAHVFASNDKGQTWTRRGGVAFPKFNFDEHMTVELRDGRLWMLARTNAGIAESYSPDKGYTWTPPEIRFPHINARFHLRRLASGRLLLVRHGQMDERTPKRSHLRAFLSEDDGITWKGGLLLDERVGVSYPDAVQAADGKIYISYDRERAAEREILMAVTTEADILAQAANTPQTRLRVLINKAMGP